MSHVTFDIFSCFISEVKPEHPFELTTLSTLAIDEPERIRSAVDVQARVARRGMVKDIRGVHAQLEALGLRDAYRLAHRRIQRPDSGVLHRIPPESASFTRLRILKESPA